MKDPAFLFYPNDWLGGTMGMTFEEKGAYMELLMMQFNRGHMTGHMIGQTIGQIWVKIQDKFKTDDEGKYYNERLEIEMKKRQDYVSSRRNNISGINQYTNPNRSHGRSYDQVMTTHMTGHMENRNDNIDKGVQGEEKTKITPETIRSVIDNYTDDKNLVESLLGWVEMRTKIKKPLTVRSIKLAIKALDKLDGNKVELVDHATLKSWQSFYAISENTYKQQAIPQPGYSQPKLPEGNISELPSIYKNGKD